MLEFDDSLVAALSRQRASVSSMAKLQRYLDWLQPRPGERVLDVGCGGGELCRAVGRLVGPTGRVTGIDLSPAAIDLAVRMTEAAGAPNVRFRRGDGHNLPFADGTFNAAVCVSVLGFCANPARVLQELWRVLRPGGRLLVASSDEDTRGFGGLDLQLGRRIVRLIADRATDPWMGRRLAPLLQAAGFARVQDEVLTTIERRFAPDAAGYVLAHAMGDYLVGAGVPVGDYSRWLLDLETADRQGAYCYNVLTFLYRARR